jgi:hypothetical protein
MAKGRKTGGRKPGSKDRHETHLLKTFTATWLRKMGQTGFNKWADDNKNEAMKIAASFVPKQVGLDDDTIVSLAALAQSLVDEK